MVNLGPRTFPFLKIRKKENEEKKVPKFLAVISGRWSHGVMVSILDPESSDPSTNPS